MDKQLLKQDNVMCPYCHYKHGVDLMRREASTRIKGRRVWFIEYYYYCQELGEEFQTSVMYSDNTARAYEAYAKSTGKNVLIVRN